MYTPPSPDAVPWELASDDPPSAAPPSRPDAGWQPSGRPVTAARVPARMRGRAAWAAFGPFVLLLGPGALYSVLVTSYILGVLGSKPLVYVKYHQGTWQGITACTALVLAAGYTLVLHRTRTNVWPARIPGWLIYPLCLLAASGDLGYTLGASAVGTLDGYTLAQYVIAGGVALWWFALLYPESKALIREPFGSHAPRARRALVASMIGFAVGTPLAAQAIMNNFLGHAPAPMVERMGLIYSGGWADASNPGFFPTLTGVKSILVTVVSSAGNAAVEEVAFAAIVLALAERGWKTWAVIAVAGALRAAMHLYYGPPGLGMAAFSGINVWALLRWRRLWPLIAAHTGYDVIDWWANGSGLLAPAGTWSSIAGLAGLCCAIAGLAFAADAVLRRGPRSSIEAGVMA